MADGTFAERQVAILEVRTTAMESHVCHGNAAMMNIAVVVSVTRAADFPFHACCDVSPNLAGRTTGVKASTVARYHRMLSCAFNPERETVRACQGALDRETYRPNAPEMCCCILTRNRAFVRRQPRYYCGRHGAAS